MSAEARTEEPKRPSLAPLALTLLVLIAGFHLGSAVTGRSLFRAIHLSTALEYAKGPINLARPIIVGFNATETPTAQEIPLWQAAAGLVFKLAHSRWFGLANLVSLAAFAAGLWPFFKLARQYLPERAAWWALVFLLAQPLIVFAAGWASTDGLCLTFSLWFLYFADKMIRTGDVRLWLPVTLFASLSATSKVPFFMTAGICSISLLLLNNIRVWRSWVLLASAGAVAAGAFVLWTKYASDLAGRAEFPYYELRASENPSMVFWYFGDWHYRLNPGTWLKGAWRFVHATLGPLPFFGLFAISLLQRGNQFARYWLLAGLVTTIIFSHLVLVHWHYYLMFCPGVALLCGPTLLRLENFVSQQVARPGLQLALSGLVLGLLAVEGLITMKISIYYDQYPAQMASIIRQHTLPADKLIVYGGDWGGEELFRSDRKGVYAYSLENQPGVKTARGLREMLTNEADLQRLRSLGYDKLVLISESPVRFAAVAVNPGSTRKRDYYPASISSAVDSWPVVYKSEDILIRQIPNGSP